METVDVVIVLDGTEAVSTDNIAAVIEGLDAGAAVVEVKVEVDEQSGVVRVVVTVAGDGDAAELLAAKIEKEKDKGDSVLWRRVVSVSIEGRGQPSRGHLCRQLPALVLVLAVLLAHSRTTGH